MYVINEDQTVTIREETWSQHFHMIFVDNPVGTGYSIVGKDSGYVTNMDEMGQQLAQTDLK